MNDYLKNRIELNMIAIKENCHGDDLDELYRGALWDWAMNISSIISNEPLREEITEKVYQSLQEIFESLYKPQ